jgi:alkanesulfonate monooxygenase SsuD/methylene tetrahydromethanopterin reductase-like flavin-dependent oxidoreductase (luciferase family)
MRERMDVFAEQIEILHRALSADPFSFEGEHYTLTEADPRPKGVQRPRPPIVVGGAGRPRSVALAARWADEYNAVSPTPEKCREIGDRIAAACEREGREPLPLSAMTDIAMGSPDEAVRKLTDLAEAGVERVMLQHLDHRNVGVLETFSQHVAPRVG